MQPPGDCAGRRFVLPLKPHGFKMCHAGCAISFFAAYGCQPRHPDLVNWEGLSRVLLLLQKSQVP